MESLDLDEFLLRLKPCVKSRDQLLNILKKKTREEFERCLNEHDFDDKRTSLSILLYLFLNIPLTKGTKYFMRILMENGADPMYQIEYEDTIAYRAFLLKDTQLIMLFLQYLHDIDAPLESSRRTALHLFVEHQNYIHLHLLLKSKPDLNKKDGRGLTPLHVAVKEMEYQKTRMLIHAGADVNAGDIAKNFTPLHLAFRDGGNDNTAISTLKLLIEKTDLGARCYAGNTPLHTLLKFHTPYTAKICELLLENGANPGVTNINGKTPLHLAVGLQLYQSPRTIYELVKILVKHNAPINAKDLDGNTVLHACAADDFWFDKSDILIFLMKLGADPNLVNNDNQTILDILRQGEEQQALNIIKHLTHKAFIGNFEFGTNLIQVIRSRKSFSSHSENCRNELAHLESVRFRSTNSFTLLDVLNTESTSKLARYTNNEAYRNLMATFNVCSSPIFGIELRNNYQTGWDRFEAQLQASLFLDEASEGRLDQYCIDEIMKYLKTDELKKLNLIPEKYPL